MSTIRVGVIAANFNEVVCEKLLAGALKTLEAQGATVEVAKVPGSLELPLAAQKMIQAKHVDAVVALGCVIRGETTHYDLVCNESARGIQQVTLETGVPIAYGVVTTENLEQALNRAGGKHGNKGSDAARVALEMVSLLRTFKEDR